MSEVSERQPTGAPPVSAPAPCRVLFVEDNPEDVGRELASLREDGLTIQHHTVDTPEELRAALTSGAWDVIICDDTMPGLSGLEALAIARSLAPATPFILASATAGEELAVEAMRAGADDYVLKQNLTRLAPAVRRELLGAESRRADVSSRKALRLLADVGAALATSLDPARLVNAVPALVARELAELCVIELAKEDGVLEPVAWAVAEPLEPEARVRLEVPFAENADALGLSVTLSVPIRADEREVGVIHLARRAPYAATERQVVEELARRVGVALENASLHEQAQRAVQLRDEFLSVASHELRTPITALQLQLQGLKELARKAAGQTTPPRLGERLDRGIATVERLGKLVEGLLDVSRISVARLRLNVEKLDLAAIVHEVVERMQEEARRASCELRVRVPAAASGTWDRLRLEQVVTNLLSNAIKYGAGKPIEVEVAQSAEQVVVRVIDHGIGISAADLERIFGRFERAVSSRHYDGLGLGLFITKRVVEAHGGAIAAEPTPSGGATFVVTLPNQTAEPSTVPAESVQASTRPTQGRLMEAPAAFAFVREVKDYAIYMIDTQGRVLTWNDGAQAIKGYSSGEIVGHSFARFFTDEDRAHGLPGRLLARAAAEGRVELQSWRVRKDGERFWADVVITAIHDDDGRLRGFVKVTRDLTERRRAEELLRQSEERLRLLVESVKDYALYMLDPDGKITTWNVGAERIKGYRAGEILGKHFSVFYPPEAIAARQPERELEIAAKVGRYEEEGWRLRKNGERFWGSVVLSAIVDPVTGVLRGFSKVTRDLTERRATEEALRRSEERLRLLVESVKDYAIFMLDPEGHVSTWNAGAQRIKGYAANEVIGRHFEMFYPREIASSGHPRRELEIAARDGRYEEEGWRIRKDGERFWANVVLSAVRDPATGALRGFAKVTRDLTERRRMENEARAAAEQAGRERARAEDAQRALQQRDDFIAVAAHELRTPLMALLLKVQGVSAAMRGRADGDEGIRKLAERLDGARQQIDRLASLVERLLDVSRMVRGELDVKLEETDLGALARQVLEDFREQALAAGSELRLDARHDVVGMWDRSRIEQVVVNLLWNAIKYGRGQPIEVRLERLELDARLVVTDLGIGIGPDDVERVFRRFERAVPTRHYGGLGLGLYISKNIVEAHGGSIHVSSRPGHGATFVVTLPLLPRVAALDAPTERERTQP